MSEHATEPKAAKGSSGKLKLIVLILIVLLVLAAGGGGAYYYFVLRAHPESSEDAHGDAHATAEPADAHDAHGSNAAEHTNAATPRIDQVPLIYHALDPVTVNIVAPGPIRFLRINITVVTRDPNVVTAIGKHLPLIRNDLLTHLSGQDYKVVNTPDGKEALREALKNMIGDILTEKREPSGVEEVLFTDLVMQ